MISALSPALGPGAGGAAPGGLRETAALLLLMTTGRLAAERYAAAVEQQGSALAVLERERLAAARQTSFFSSPEADLEAELRAAENQITSWRAQGMEPIGALDGRYPGLLAAAYDHPPLIFVAGRMKPRDERSVAVIGSREASPQGTRMAAALAEHLVRGGYTVVSGLAAGIDTAAHSAALARGGRTIAVIGTGLSRCYPRSNVILQRRIAAQCAVVSQFLPDAPPSRESFPLRNALMSGLSLATVIVEASATSGTRTQARCALRQGRPVFLLEPVLRHRWARELAERTSVHVVDGPGGVIERLERLTAAGPLVA